MTITCGSTILPCKGRVLREEKAQSHMSHERLAALIQAHQEALTAAQESASADAHANILGILSALEKGEIHEARAQRLLGQHALLATDAPGQATLYRQAAADIRQMQREERGR